MRALELLVEGAGASTWADKLGDAEAARAVAAGVERWRPRLEAERILSAFTQGVAFGQLLLTRADASWSTAIDDLGPHAPAGPWVRGNPATLERCARSDRQVAV